MGNQAGNGQAGVHYQTMVAIQMRGEKGQELTGEAEVGTVNGDGLDTAQDGQDLGWLVVVTSSTWR